MKRAADARAVAFSVLRSLRDESHFLQFKLDAEVAKAKLSQADRRFAWRLVLGTSRWLSHLDAHIKLFVKRNGMKKIEPDVLMILRLAVYQLHFLDRIPAHAAVHSAVELTKANVGPRATGFVNGVLRQMLRAPQAPQFSKDACGLAAQYGHPQWLVERYIKAYGFEAAHARCALNNQDAPLTIRAALGERDKIAQTITSESGAVAVCDYAPNGLKIIDHPNPFGSPSFSERIWWVQDEASQLVVDLLDPQSGETVWDVCAAPGGKSRYIADRMKGSGRLLSTDIDPTKVERLDDALPSNLIETRVHDGRQRLAETFDRVLIDAPCTALGLVRRHPEIRWRRRPRDIKERAQLQLEILSAAALSVNEGGILVYSVCSDMNEEGTGVIEAFLSRHPEFQFDAPPAESPVAPLYRAGRLELDPLKLDCDAFFATRLRRRRD